MTLTVTCLNFHTGRRLARLALPALPRPGDSLFLAELAYEVVGCVWRLQPDQPPEIELLLRPQPGEDGQRPAAYPEEAELWSRWAADSAIGHSAAGHSAASTENEP